MADGSTTSYSFTLPEIGASEDTWGTKLNANWNLADDLLDGTSQITPDLGSGWKVGGTAITVTGADINSVTARVSQSAAEFTGYIKEGTFTITDAVTVDIDPANGTIQTWTLGANRTPSASGLTDGRNVTLRISDGAGFTIDWATVGVVWMNGVEPTLNTSGYTHIQLWCIGTTIYGALIGLSAS